MSVTSRFLFAAGRRCLTQLNPALLNTNMSASVRPSLYKYRNLCTQSDQSATSFHVQDYEDFQERVLDSDRPVLVQFHADWCGPCKQLGPRLETLVDAREGAVLLAKVDVDECDFALDYEVQSIPHVIGFNEGEAVGQFIGMKTDVEINQFIDAVEQSN